MLCCSYADGHRTGYDMRQDQYWVPIEGEWYRTQHCLPKTPCRQGCEGLSGVTPIVDIMPFVIRSIAVMACRSSIEVTTCGDSAGFSVVTTQGWM
jgi:hypothetical protein